MQERRERARVVLQLELLIVSFTNTTSHLSLDSQKWDTDLTATLTGSPTSRSTYVHPLPAHSAPRPGARHKLS